MSQHYSTRERESDPNALPDLEIFHSEDGYVSDLAFVLPHEPGATAYGLVTGVYYWFCFPGCLPDSEPIGPFNTEREALEDARQSVGALDDG